MPQGGVTVMRALIMFLCCATLAHAAEFDYSKLPPSDYIGEYGVGGVPKDWIMADMLFAYPRISTLHVPKDQNKDNWRESVVFTGITGLTGDPKRIVEGILEKDLPKHCDAYRQRDTIV